MEHPNIFFLYDICYPKILEYSSSKLGVKMPLPILDTISSRVQKRPPSSSVSLGLTAPS